MKAVKFLPENFIQEVLAIEAENAKEAGALGYMARALVQATMPHKAIKENEFSRRNGSFVLSILSPSQVGLPYGSIPRLLMAWITTEAVRTKERKLILGDSLSCFMRELDIVPTGGRWGSITRLREQSRRLFTSTISCWYEDEYAAAESGFRIADNHMLWWNPQNPEQTSFFDSYIQLSEAFFNEVTENPVPIDMRALKTLSKSPLAIDIYCWLTYRVSYLSKKVELPWTVLQMQFGSSYKANAQGIRNFKKAFLRELKKVRLIYKDIDVDDGASGLMLKPSNTHIPKRSKRKGEEQA